MLLAVDLADDNNDCLLVDLSLLLLLCFIMVLVGLAGVVFILSAWL